MVFTPAEQVIPAKARVGPDDDRDLRPALPNPADDPFQFPPPIPRPHRYWNTATGRTADASPRRCTAGDNSSGGSNRERTGLPAGHGSGRRSHPGPARSPRVPIRGTPRRQSTIQPAIRFGSIAIFLYRSCSSTSAPVNSNPGSAYTCPPAPSPDLRPAAASPPTDRLCPPPPPASDRCATDHDRSDPRTPDRVRRCAAPTTPRPCVRSTAGSR